jgi:hypothetical protein
MRKNVARDDSVVDIEERFTKMVNSESSHKKMTVIKYTLVTSLVLAFCLFYLIFSLNLINKTSDDIRNYRTISKRPGLLRSARSVYS